MTQSISDNTAPTFDDFEQAFSETLFDSFDTGYYIGMMSGTSLDGMDAVICQFDAIGDDKDQHPHTNKIIATHSKDFPDDLREVLLALCLPNGTANLAYPASKIILEQQPQSELDWFGWASREYAEFASTVVNELLEKSGITADAILAIGCHGQTVRHRPNLGFTLQLVDPNIIAERTGISVVTDFRRRDMAVGGQGAPLAPAFHLAQFSQTMNTVSSDNTANGGADDLIIVNLGGIANITVLPADNINNIIGYDTGPANTLLDGWYQSRAPKSVLSDNPLYDASGRWAQSGTVDKALLSQLLTHPYFLQPAPKSTGREDFNLNWLQRELQHFSQPLSDVDVQATLTALTVQTTSQSIYKEAKRLNLAGGKVVVCGGGAHNDYLMQLLADALPHWQVASSVVFDIEPTWVEAMAFAWLARQTIMGETGNLPAVTGASKPVVLGQVCFA